MLEVESRLKEIEKEIAELKVMVMQPSKKRKVSLKGVLKGVKIDDEDIEESKKSLFKAVHKE